MLCIRVLVQSFAVMASTVVCLRVSAASQQFYVITPIGPLPEHIGPTWAWDINDENVVYGVAHINGSRESRCFVVDDGNYTVFASDQGHPFIWPGAVNNTGTLVGSQMVTIPPLGTQRQAFIGAPEFLPDLFPQFAYADASYGHDINNSSPPWGTGGQRLGQTMGTGGFSKFRGYVVLLDGNPNPAIAISALGGAYVRGEALNGAHDVVGASLTANGPLRAFLRAGAGGATTNLGTLGGSHSWATDVNNAQQIVGWSRVADGGTRAFLYQAGAMTDLGTLGGHWSEARSINEQGQIVGMSFNADASPRAFLFESVEMIDLNSRIAEDSGWVLQMGRAVNESGSIAGWGRFQGETRGFMLTPRTPGDATLDGKVDVDDLLQIINQWGKCPTTCAPDFTGDGMVDVDDLLIVINNWDNAMPS